MTQPRPVEKGEIKMATRRTTERQYLLRPDPQVNQIVEYTAAYAAQQTGVKLIALMAMSNHVHTMALDEQGRIPEFEHRFYMLSSKSLNDKWGHSESVYSSAQAGLTKAIRIEDVLEKTIYTLTNPVRAGLVARVTDWPGANSLFLMPGKKKVVKRPLFYFDKEGDMPEEVVLEMCTPPGYSDEEWARLLHEGIREVEQKEEAERARTGRRVLGRKAVLAQSHLDKPSTKEKRWQRIPHIACKDKSLRIEAIKKLQTFRTVYAKALERFRAGLMDVVFPVGTWMMVQRYGVRVAPS